MTDTIPDVFYKWFEYPFNVLNKSTQTWFSLRLDPERNTFGPLRARLQDWRGVAEVLGFDTLSLDNWERQKHPTMELFKQWGFTTTATIGAFISALQEIERFDILLDPDLVVSMERDISIHIEKLRVQESLRQNQNPVQVQEVESSDQTVDEFKNITVNEADTGIPEEFDAFVCYTHKDFSFVSDMMYRLETVHGLKLCIPDRDLMPGCAQYVILAKLIQERCRKMIIVLSPDYTTSDECRFQTLFAHSLAPGAQQKKLIPIMYRQCPIPSILNYICLVDYTRCDVVDWFWQRLANSLKADRRCHQFNPMALAAQSTQSTQSHQNQLRLNCDLSRLESSTSLVSTQLTSSVVAQPLPCSSGLTSSVVDQISSEKRSYSNPTLTSSAECLMASSNLIYPEDWKLGGREETPMQQPFDDDPCSFEMDMVQIDHSGTFVDINKTAPQVKVSKTLQKTSVMSRFTKKFLPN